MHVQFVFPTHLWMLWSRAQRNCPAIAHHSIKNADDMTIGDSTFGIPLVVATNDIIMFPHPQHAMEYVLAIVALIERYIQSMQSALRLWLNDQQIPMLAQKGHHAVTRIGVNQRSLLGYYLFKCGHEYY